MVSISNSPSSYETFYTWPVYFWDTQNVDSFQTIASRFIALRAVAVQVTDASGEEPEFTAAAWKCTQPAWTVLDVRRRSWTAQSGTLTELGAATD